jgi:vancomycin resistance protein YoaR
MEKEIVKEKSQDEQENKTLFKKVDKVDEKSKKEMEEKTKKPINKKIIIAIIIAIIAILLFISTIFSIMNLNSEKIISGVTINGIEVSGLTKNEANEKINSIYSKKSEKEIEINYQDYKTTLNPVLLEVNYDTEKAVDNACSFGKEGNIFVNNYKILFTLIAKKDIDVSMSINEDVAKQTIEDIGVNLPDVVVESSYSVEDDELIITKGKEGIFIDTDLLLEKLKEKLNEPYSDEECIEIPIIEKKPEEIDIEKIHSEVYTEAKDAYYTKDPFAVYPEVEGVDFDIEQAKQILAEEKEEYIIPLTITKPKVTLNDIGTEAFPDKLATFTTKYDASDADRTTNLRIACQKINGKVVLAGETFSYNKALGARTASAGYKNAKVYENGEVVDGIGGGICQISSTLYNTVLMANLEIVERRNHQFVTSYVPAGRDATVVYGVTDFKFKNTRQFPVRIVASAQGGIATVSIYGIKEENEYTFSFNTKTIASIPFTTQYVEDDTISVGTEKVKQKGANGLKTETYITKMLNGQVISTKLLSKDTYDAMTRIVLKGTAGEVTTTTPSTEVKATPSTTEKPSTDKQETTTEDNETENKTVNENKTN